MFGVDATTGSKLAVGLLACVMILVGIFDVYLALSRIPGETPSEVILTFFQRYPVIALFMGVLVGHLLWPQYR